MPRRCKPSERLSKDKSKPPGTCVKKRKPNVVLKASVRAAKNLGYMQKGEFKLLPKRRSPEYLAYKKELEKILARKPTAKKPKSKRAAKRPAKKQTTTKSVKTKESAALQDGPLVAPVQESSDQGKSIVAGIVSALETLDDTGRRQFTLDDDEEYADCQKILCPRDIVSKSDYRQWALRGGHPDKGGDVRVFGQVAECASKELYCNSRKPQPYPSAKDKKLIKEAPGDVTFRQPQRYAYAKTPKLQVRKAIEYPPVRKRAPVQEDDAADLGTVGVVAGVVNAIEYVAAPVQRLFGWLTGGDVQPDEPEYLEEEQKQPPLRKRELVTERAGPVVEEEQVQEGATTNTSPPPPIRRSERATRGRGQCRKQGTPEACERNNPPCYWYEHDGVEQCWGDDD